MKKLHMLFALALAVLSQSVWAAPIGWYDYQATWRDGTFKGQFYYDSSAAARITAVKGTLVDLVQTTSIDKNAYLDYDEIAAWNFLSNTNPADMGGHDAGFYLTLLDLGATLTVDAAGLNGLYDWSSASQYIDDSPLLSFTLGQANAVPEPGSTVLLLAGMAGLFSLRRARSQRA
ncbi:PEP-CTERM sorting domain-containing protein [Massilia sp. UMI-21]|nr:PEP-CTERM sorting domain-containing protein [Massilia sp. UMI-21]